MFGGQAYQFGVVDRCCPGLLIQCPGVDIRFHGLTGVRQGDGMIGQGKYRVFGKYQLIAVLDGLEAGFKPGCPGGLFRMCSVGFAGCVLVIIFLPQPAKATLLWAFMTSCRFSARVTPETSCSGPSPKRSQDAVSARISSTPNMGAARSEERRVG